MRECISYRFRIEYTSADAAIHLKPAKCDNRMGRDLMFMEVKEEYQNLTGSTGFEICNLVLSCSG